VAVADVELDAVEVLLKLADVEKDTELIGVNARITSEQHD
jgi:hypothetical protein